MNERIKENVLIFKTHFSINNRNVAAGAYRFFLLQNRVGLRRLADNQSGGLGGQGVLRLEVGARHLALPQPVVKPDVHGQDVQAAVAGGRPRGPLIFPAINSDGLEKKQQRLII